MAAAGSAEKRPRTAEEEPDPIFTSSLAQLFFSLYKVVVKTGPCIKYYNSHDATTIVQLEFEFAVKLLNEAVRALGTAISTKIDMYRELKRLTVNSAVSEEVPAIVAQCMQCVEDFTTMLLDLQQIKDLLLPRHHTDLLSLLNEISPA